MFFFFPPNRKLLDDNLSEGELNIAMNKDLSSCCKKEKGKSGITPEPIRSNAFQPARSRKRTASSSSSVTPPPFKKNAGIDGSAILPKLLVTGKGVAGQPNSEAEVVCTPDILSMFEPDAQQAGPPPALVRHYAPSYQQQQQHLQQQQQQQKQQQQMLLHQQQLQRQIAVPAPVPILPKRPPGPLSARSLSIQAPATTAPVYHRINGFKVDLNIAAQQETYRLPNGKLIQVKKQTPALVPTSGPRPGLPNVPPRPVLHNRNLPATPTLLNVRYNNVVNPANAVLNNSSQNFVPPTIKPSNHGNTPLGQARTMFEGKVFASMDVCKHIMGKIQALTNSTAYKTVKSYNDLKELHIHLSYLFTYAIGRFKTLQDTGTEDMKKLGLVIDATNAALNDNSDDDDLQIIEPHTTLIELDSDGEDTLRVPPVPPLSKIQLPASLTITKKLVAVPKPSPTPSNTSNVSITEMEIPMPEMLYDDEKLKMITRVMLTKCDVASVMNMRKKLKKLLNNDKENQQENINEVDTTGEKIVEGLNGNSDKVSIEMEKVVEEIEKVVEKESDENKITEIVKDDEKSLDKSVEAEVIEKMDTCEEDTATAKITEPTTETMEVDEEEANDSSSKEESKDLNDSSSSPDKEKVIEENGVKEVEIDDKVIEADKEADKEEQVKDKEIEADKEDYEDEGEDEETSQDSKSTQDDEKTETEPTSEDSSSLESSDKIIKNDINSTDLKELIPNSFEANPLTSNI